MPVASHIQHMPSHTWNEVGHVAAKSVRANTRPGTPTRRPRRAKGFSYAPTHNLHMLLFAASMDGQGAVAMQAGRDYTRLGGDTMHQVLTLLRFGRFEEILEVTKQPSGQGRCRHVGLRPGLRRAAHRRRRGRARSTSRRSRRSSSRARRRHLPLPQGEPAHGPDRKPAGRRDPSRGRATSTGAIAAFERAAEFDDAQDYDEPEPIPFAARHWLGAALLEAERYAEAEEVYRTELVDHPHNVWSLHGLKQALGGAGQDRSRVDADFDEEHGAHGHLDQGVALLTAARDRSSGRRAVPQCASRGEAEVFLSAAPCFEAASRL